MMGTLYNFNKEINDLALTNMAICLNFLFIGYIKLFFNIYYIEIKQSNQIGIFVLRKCFLVEEGV